jgi:hypothetical protein
VPISARVDAAPDVDPLTVGYHAADAIVSTSAAAVFAQRRMFYRRLLLRL